ncbi:MAG: histidine phosphatase family protein [Chloroflexi bacterium]|nr:histidine phosphatase family protein [Chloroflexota bacterium]
MVRLLLVRHGQTEWNVQGRTQGGGQLTPKGRRDVEALALRLQRERVAAIYASPSARTRKTAEVLAQALNVEVNIREGLLDLDYGQWSGSTFEAARESAPDLFRQWEEAPHTVRFPGGESLSDLRQRVMAVIQEVLERHPEETVAIVTHDSPIRTVVCSVLGLDDSHHQQVETEPGSLTVAQVGQGNQVLVALNDGCHLEVADASGR